MINYDELVRECMLEWRKTPTHKFAFQKIALERHVIPLLYYNIRKKILKEKVIDCEQSYQRKFNQLSKKIIHIFWILLWSVKWLRFWSQKNSRFMVVAVGSDRRLTFAYLENLLRFAQENNFCLVSLNVICRKEFLFQKEIFYYPRFIYQYKSASEIRNLSKSWMYLFDELTELINRKIKIKVEFNSLSHFIKDYSLDYFTVKYLLRKFQDRIVFLIQDFDYTTNRNIYCEIFKRANIKTIALNHSVLTYNHLYESVYSDYLLVWGEHQKQRAEKLSSIKQHTIAVIGYPLDTKFHSTSSSDKKYWVYFLPSYENPAAESIYRSFELTMAYINILEKVIKKHQLNIQLIVRTHPNDSQNSIEKAGFKLSKDSFSKMRDHAQLILAEDSTVLIESLNTDIPIIYIASKNKRDPFDFTHWNTAEIVYSPDELEGVVLKSHEKPIDLERRFQNFYFYFGKTENFYLNLKTELNRILCANSNPS